MSVFACMVKQVRYIEHAFIHQIHTHKHSSAWHSKGRNYALNMRSKEVVHRKYSNIKKEGRKGEDGNYYGHIIG